MVYKFRFSADKFSIVLRSKAQSMISSKPHSSNSLLRVVMSLYKIDRSDEGIKRVEVEMLLTKKSRPTVKVGDSAKAQLESRIFRLGLV